MALTTADIAHILLALALLLISAHAGGSVFARFRQPRVIGEILGGLLLGPTLFQAVLPHQQAWLFPKTGATPVVLGALYQLGLLLLMFVSGAEVRSSFRRSEIGTIFSVAVTGMVFPFLAGLVLLKLISSDRFIGPAGNSTSFLLIFAIAIAVTSIPVISRIMHDLGILDTAFARIVLGVAVIEDIVLYVVLAIALSLAKQTPGALFGLPELLGIKHGAGWSTAYHSVVTIAFLGFFLLFGRSLYGRLWRFRFNLLRKSSPVAHQLVFMLAASLACMFLGIVPLFGAFVAGIVVGSSGTEPPSAQEAIKGFSFAFFVPVYFAVVGLNLDLLKGFSPGFFLFFFLFACAAKASSVYAGAKLSGRSSRASRNLAVAMNARGGPGIVLASVAYEARIITQPFYAVLVLLAVITSLVAGSWLERVPKSHLLEVPDTAPLPDDPSLVSPNGKRMAAGRRKRPSLR
jgi:Kef-type K+ transport system membrane component KefB